LVGHHTFTVSIRVQIPIRASYKICMYMLKYRNKIKIKKNLKKNNNKIIRMRFFSDLPIKNQMGLQEAASIYFEYLQILHDKILVVLVFLLTLISIIMLFIIIEAAALNNNKFFNKQTITASVFTYEVNEKDKQLTFDFVKDINKDAGTFRFSFIKKLLRMKLENPSAFILAVQLIELMQPLKLDDRVIEMSEELMTEKSIYDEYLRIKYKKLLPSLERKLKIINFDLQQYETLYDTISSFTAIQTRKEIYNHIHTIKKDLERHFFILEKLKVIEEIDKLLEITKMTDMEKLLDTINPGFLKKDFSTKKNEENYLRFLKYKKLVNCVLKKIKVLGISLFEMPLLPYFFLEYADHNLHLCLREVYNSFKMTQEDREKFNEDIEERVFKEVIEEAEIYEDVSVRSLYNRFDQIYRYCTIYETKISEVLHFYKRSFFTTLMVIYTNDMYKLLDQARKTPFIALWSEKAEKLRNIYFIFLIPIRLLLNTIFFIKKLFGIENKNDIITDKLQTYTFNFIINFISFLEKFGFFFNIKSPESPNPILPERNRKELDYLMQYNLIPDTFFSDELTAIFVPQKSLYLFDQKFLKIFENKINKVNAIRELTSGAFLEMFWTIMPCIILLFIAIPSLSLSYFAEEGNQPFLTAKVIGNQWYWSYESASPLILKYCDKPVVYDSYLVQESDLIKGQPRLLTVDQPLYLPAFAETRILVTALDVLHSFAVPSFGIKIDAIPGRLNQVITFINREGVFYGQCSELCGVGHAFMPIEVRTVQI
jgi:cytochrome c oxidase subunit 2